MVLIPSSGRPLGDHVTRCRTSSRPVNACGSLEDRHLCMATVPQHVEQVELTVTFDISPDAAPHNLCKEADSF